MQSKDNWDVSDGAIAAFEKALRSHSRVESFVRSDDIFFHLLLKNGNEVGVLLVEEYALGLAVIHRAIDEFPSIEHIITCGNWNGYTREAKEFGAENGFGIFMLEEFLGALHCKDPIKYVRKDKEGNPVHHYRAA